MGKSKILRIIVGVVLLIFLGLILSIVNGMFGNPVSAAIATREIRAYVKDTYPDMDLEISRRSIISSSSEYYSRVNQKRV